jgi:hypothetical protein
VDAPKHKPRDLSLLTIDNSSTQLSSEPLRFYINIEYLRSASGGSFRKNDYENDGANPAQGGTQIFNHQNPIVNSPPQVDPG